MNLTQFIASLQLIIAHLYDNIDSLKKKNDNLESLVIFKKSRYNNYMMIMNTIKYII